MPADKVLGAAKKLEGCNSGSRVGKINLNPKEGVKPIQSERSAEEKIA